MTRRVTSHMFSSLNGVVEDPHFFQFDAFGPEEGEAMGAALAPVTDAIIGRKLWEEWKQYWVDKSDPFAEFINPIRKHVLTSQPAGTHLGWNSTIIDTDPAAYVKKLRSQGEGDIAVVGGIDTVRQLFMAGMIDALTLTTHPVVTNQGRRLFDDAVPLTRLHLLDSRITSAGNAILTYGLRK